MSTPPAAPGAATDATPATTIRDATLDDAARIAELGVQLGYGTTPAAVRQRLAALAPLAGHVVLVGVVDARVCGWLHCGIAYAIEDDPWAQILALVVDEHVRSRGLGAALVAAAERWAVAAGVAEMRVRSRDSRERAHAFYRRHGYQQWKRQVTFRKPLG